MSTKYKKRKVNVLVAADHAGYKGNLNGVGRYLLNVLPRLDLKRFNITLVVLRDTASLDSEIKTEGINIIQLNRHKFDPFTLYDFVKIIRREMIDILHLHQYGSSNFGRIAGMITGVPTILHAHGPDLNYPVYQRIADWFLSKLTNYVLAVSQSTREECVRNRSINRDKIVIIPNGIPLEHFRPLSPSKVSSLKSHWNIPTDAPVVGTITRFHKEKGNRYLLESTENILKILPNTRFLLIGNGPLSSQLKEQARQLAIERNVIFTGFQNDVASMLSIFDVTVFTSLNEGHPQVLLEAMAMRNAIVATRVNGIKEILSDGTNGLLIPPSDPHSLAEKIIHLIYNEKKRYQLGIEAYRESRKYSIEEHICRIENIYNSQINI